MSQPHYLSVILVFSLSLACTRSLPLSIARSLALSFSLSHTPLSSHLFHGHLLLRLFLFCFYCSRLLYLRVFWSICIRYCWFCIFSDIIFAVYLFNRFHCIFSFIFLWHLFPILITHYPSIRSPPPIRNWLIILPPLFFTFPSHYTFRSAAASFPSLAVSAISHFFNPFSHGTTFLAGRQSPRPQPDECRSGGAKPAVRFSRLPNASEPRDLCSGAGIGSHPKNSLPSVDPRGCSFVLVR